MTTRWVDGMPTTEVTPVTIWSIHTPDLGHQMVMVMVMNDLLPPLLCNVNRPSHSEIQLFKDLTMKIHGHGHVCGQRSRSHLTLKIQRSRLWSRSNLMVTFEALEFNRYVCFSFRGNRTIFGWDIANSIYDLEIQGPGLHKGQIGCSHLSPKVQSICLLFISWHSDHFWMRYNTFHILKI